jgi:Kef-type K+ transport system membrane component KefB
MVLALLPVLIAFAFAGARYVIVPLIKRFDAFYEFIFLLAIGWCLALAMLAHSVNLSFEIGAFVAGVSLANSAIANFITLTLRPLRDFFLVLFFFSVGASIDLVLLLDVIVPTVVLAGTLVVLKPLVFRGLLRLGGEDDSVSTEIGMRLGQASEFSLLVTYVAGATLLTAEGAHVIQGATVITLLLSTYLVIFRYPSPIAVSARLRRD